ncbi:hypothetical protein V6C27_09450 [Peptococcaceae bacterium 1198_IL3148]
MNKLQGFYELKWIGIPAITWKIFTEDTIFDENLLWTIRVAVRFGEDINLPRAIGVKAEEAKFVAKNFLNDFKENGLIIYYPFFIAIKSGNMEIKESRIIIEAVKNDLWNLTTGGERDVTIFIDRLTKEMQFYGDETFLTMQEIDELLRYAARIRVKYKDYIFDRSSVMVEWSYAINTDINRKPIGERYLVFYECRVLNF